MTLCRYSVLVILLSLALQSCEKKKTELSIDSYPMNQGSEWHYQRTMFLTKYASNYSDKVVDVDTFHQAYRIRVTKDTVLNDTMYTTSFEIVDKENHNYKGQQYYYMDKEGLKLYATGGSSGPIIIGKSATDVDSNPLFSMGSFPEYLPSVQNNNLMYSIPPRLSLQFPLTEDSYWTCIQGNSSRNWRIDKKVAGRELLQVGNRKFSCFRVEWLYFDYVKDSDINVTDWIAKEGLVQRIVEVLRLDSDSLDLQYLIDFETREVIQLVDLNLK